MNQSEHDIPTAARKLGDSGAGPDTAPLDDDSPAGDGDREPIALVGYRRKGDPRGRRRLYMTPTSETYVEFAIADIVDPPFEIDDLEPGQVAIWVRGDTRLNLVNFPASSLRARPPWPRH